MRLHPWEFRAYTPGEWRELLKGYAEQQRAEKRQMAWAIANLMNATGNFKRPVTIESLIGRPGGKRSGKNLTQAEMAEIKRRFRSK